MTLDQTEEIIALAFQYIRLLVSTGLDEWRFSEVSHPFRKQ